MRQILLSTLILAFCLSAHAQGFSEGGDYRVEKIIDGATLKLTNGEEVRLIGVEIPKDPKLAQEAKNWLVNQKLNSYAVRKLEFDEKKKDEEGRLLAYVYFCPVHMAMGHPSFAMHYDGDACYMLNGQIIYRGLVNHAVNPPNVKHAQLFNKMKDQAREQGRGIWREDSSRPFKVNLSDGRIFEITPSWEKIEKDVKVLWSNFTWEDFKKNVNQSVLVAENVQKRQNIDVNELEFYFVVFEGLGEQRFKVGDYADVKEMKPE